jgi:serine/threonine protein kinase
MLGHLVVIAGPDQGQQFSIEAGKTLVIGRGQNTQTRFKDPQVSRVHCRIQDEGGRLMLVDAGSASGTIVNGRKITIPHELKPNDVIQIGATQLRVQLTGTPEATTMVVGEKPALKATVQAAGQLAELVGHSVSHFRVDAVIARAQAGMVFKAHDTEKDRAVAFKVLWPEFSKNDEEMQRFVRAMKTMLPLRHPNIVRLYGAGRTGDYCWMAMEFVDGESLTNVIERIGTAGMLDWRFSLRVAVHIARALVYAEEQSIIHRNIKPANILVTNADKVAKLGDLMLAKALEGTLAEQITRPGQLVGDIAYMSPERTRAGGAEIDVRSDIYSLGATIYALFTGRSPFDAGSLGETIQMIRTADAVSPRKFQLAIPELFEGTVLKMLAKRPDDRFQSAKELLSELERVAKYQRVTL